jgi:hypothetical protein
MFRARSWIILGATLVALIAVTLVALPAVVRPWVENRIEAATGRPTHIQNVDLNLFTRRLRLEGFQLGGDGTSPARFDRLEGRFRLWPLLRGHLSFEEVTLVGPALHLVRVGSDEFNISDAIAQLAAHAQGEPLHLTLDHFVLERGRVVFEDRVVRPASTWKATDVSLEGRDVATAVNATRGTATMTFALAGASVKVTAEQLGLRPAHARASVTFEGLDLAQVWKYVPSQAAVRPEQGTFTGQMELSYSAAGGARASSEATIKGLVLRRLGQTQPFVTTPTLSLSSRAVVYRAGVVRAGRLEVSGDPSVVDASVAPPRRYDLQDVIVTADDLGYPAEAPGRVAFTARLPDAGQVRATGSLQVFPVAIDLEVALARIELSLLQAYLPPDSLFTVDRGRLSADLRLTCCAAEQVHLSGSFEAPDLIVGRRGQAEPFMTHRSLAGSVTDLRLGEGSIAATRLTLSDSPVLVDGSITPPQRFDFRSLALTAEAITWPAEQPARVQLTAAVYGGGTARVRGTVDPSTWAADLRATLRDVDLTRVRPYLPADTTITVASGRLGAAFTLKHERGRGVRFDGHGLVRDLGLARPDESEPFLTDPRLELTIKEFVIADGQLSAASLAMAGAPIVIDRRLGSGRRLAVPGLRLALSDIRWPGSGPVGVEIQGSLPDSGTFGASGTVEFASRSIDATLTLRDAALGPFAAFLPIQTTLQGRAEAQLDLRATLSDPLRVEARGQAVLRAAVLGPEESPVVRVERVEASAIEAVWPDRVTAQAVVVKQPSVLIERGDDGVFSLRAMLQPRRATPDAAAPTGARAAESPARPRIEVGRFAIEQGSVRFVDRSVRPFYSEEVTNLDLSLRGLTSAPGPPALLEVQGVVGGDAALDLRGEVAPLYQPLFIDVAGELRDFAVPRTNPYAREHLGWFARTGSLTASVEYRIVRNRLEATNEIVVQRLNVDRVPGGDGAVKDRLGLPLGLVVSLLKDARGEIRLAVPVSGRLGAPEFSFGGAFATVLNNVVTRIVTAPFRTIGKIFRKGDEVEEVAIDPLLFDPGSIAISAEGDRHLQRVADFLRASPFVGLELRSAVSRADLQHLKSEALSVRIQKFQDAQALEGLATATRRLFRAEYPNQYPPDDLDALLEVLRDREPAPSGTIEQLRRRRIEAVRQRLAEAAGVERERLLAGPPPEISGPDQSGRVQFELRALGD